MGTSATSTTTTAGAQASGFGGELRRWRDERRLSQLDLSLVADVSQRHVSHLETGKSMPSRAMVLRLGAALGLPLRARNDLLRTAGFAPAYPQRRLDDADSRAIRRVLVQVLEAHEPAPAYVVDRGWNLVLANDATARLMAMLPDPAAAAGAAGGNVLRLLLHPDGLRHHVVNIDEVRVVLLGRLRRELAEHGGADDLASLLAELEPMASGYTIRPTEPGARDLAVPLHLRLGGMDLRFLTMIATIGAAHDVTVEELRIETLLPADDATRDTLLTLAGR
ncbi:MAG TPA: helix-turn-helix transcriptional regulator [Nitriliruptoraceae bacterium]|nr:helix-turn-helix transcriptional regulator [Nitriliruptoraceae bacterium]